LEKDKKLDYNNSMKRLTKININPDSLVLQAQTIEEYRKDQENGWFSISEGKSPPIAYEMVGELIGEIKCNSPILMDRLFRSDITGALIEMRGVFHSSIVQNVEERNGVTYVTTDNSLYKVEDYVEQQ
jgi:hypothetical protein